MLACTSEPPSELSTGQVVQAVQIAVSERQPSADGFRHPLAVDEPIAAAEIFAGAWAPAVVITADEEGNLVHEAGLMPVETFSMDDLDPLEVPVRVRPPPEPAPVLSPVLAARSTSTEPEPVVISIRRDDVEPVFATVWRAIAEGKVRTQADYEQQQIDATLARRAVIGQRNENVAQAVTSTGGRTLHRCGTLACQTALLTPGQAKTLAETHADVVRIGPVSKGVALNGTAGAPVSHGSQISSMLFHNHDGGLPGGTLGQRVRIAQIENGILDFTHPGFGDVCCLAGSGPRVHSFHECDMPDGCSQFSGTLLELAGDLQSLITPHATNVAGLAIGDLRDEQDDAFPDEIEDIDEQWDKSGYSPEAMISDAYKVDTVVESIAALDDIVGQSGSTRPEIVLQAWSDPDDDPQCKGEDGWSRAANDLYESGILLFQGAGNFGGTSTNCKVGSPGSAIGAFTVGGHSATACAASITENNVRTGGPWGTCNGFSSSWGGNSTEGKGRTIIDISAYACRQEIFTKSGTAEFEAFGDYNDAACGTSYSVATATGAAADFIEYFNTKVHATLLDNNPGLLFANMLLLADRGTASGASAFSEFDNRLGAGRLRMRFFWDTANSDDPFQAATGSVCVPHNTVALVGSINGGNPIPSTVNDFKAVIYWYDRRHEAGNTLDDFNLVLRDTDTWLPIRSSTDADDNKEMVWSSSVANKRVQLEIHGLDVTADNEGCGTNSNVVYFAWFWEDDARDDPEGPGSEIAKESP